MSKTKITGYKMLSAAEVEQINQINELGSQIGAAIETLRQDPDTDKRLVALANTDLQAGIMWAVRSIAKPETF